MPSILIVEDEEVLGKSIAAALSDDGFETLWIPSGESALELLDHRAVDLALMDVRLPGMSGLDLLRILSDQHPDTVCIIMTARGEVTTAVTAMKLGAVDFLLKPLDLDEVSELAKRHCQHRRIAQNWKYLQRDHAQRFGLHQFLGNCPRIESAKSMVRRLGRIQPRLGVPPPSVLISGATGTGKDLLARAIHYEGPRRDGPFVQINCAALPPALLESELFGHVKGSFTGAQSSKSGLFQVADGGTLFMDELGAMDLALQSKVLVAIDSLRIRPVGSTVEVLIDVQFVAAMNQDPQEWLDAGKLRADLYHRLRVINIELPRLAQRGDDIPRLADHFLSHYCRKFDLPRKRLSTDAKKRMRSYHWPGNVRELAHRVESAVLLSQDEVIDSEFLPESVLGCKKNGAGVSASGIDIDFSNGPISLDGVEEFLIREALESTGFNITKAAHLLGLSRDTLRYRVEKHGIVQKRNGAAL